MLIDLEILQTKYQLTVDGIVHVGVNNGFEVEVYKKLFPEATVHMFEPQKKLYERLKTKFLKDNNINLYNFALGNVEKKAKLNLSPNSNGSASLLKPTLHKVYHPEVKFDGEEIVDVKKYDNLEIKNINFMNIDVQGYELNVLKGAEKSLNKIDYLIVEINRKELYKNSTILKDLDYFLYMKGFDRQITVFWDKYCTWGDAFYIKSNLLTRKLRIKSAVKNSFFKFRILYNLSTFFRKILSLR